MRVCRASRSPPIRAERSITPSVSRWHCLNRNCGGSCVMPKVCCLRRAGAAFGSSVELSHTLNWAPKPDGTSSRKGVPDCPSLAAVGKQQSVRGISQGARLAVICLALDWKVGSQRLSAVASSSRESLRSSSTMYTTTSTPIGHRRKGCSLTLRGRSTAVGGLSTSGSHALISMPSLLGSWRGWRQREPSRRGHRTSRTSLCTR